jgi:hypothetical protein
MRGQLGDLLPADGARPTTAPNGTYVTYETYVSGEFIGS